MLSWKKDVFRSEFNLSWQNNGTCHVPSKCRLPFLSFSVMPRRLAVHYSWWYVGCFSINMICRSQVLCRASTPCKTATRKKFVVQSEVFINSGMARIVTSSNQVRILFKAPLMFVDSYKGFCCWHTCYR